jgi:hypothetical protein
VIPPRPRARAAVAAPRRRVRSSRTGFKASNFDVRAATVVLPMYPTRAEWAADEIDYSCEIPYSLVRSPPALVEWFRGGSLVRVLPSEPRSGPPHRPAACNVLVACKSRPPQCNRKLWLTPI